MKAAVEKLKKTVESGDTEAIKADTDELQKAFAKLSEKLYAQGGAQGGGDPGAGNGGQGGDGFYNASYEDKSGN